MMIGGEFDAGVKRKKKKKKKDRERGYSQVVPRRI
jgi:hypothetical protein